MSPRAEMLLGSAAFLVLWFWLFNTQAALHSNTCAYLRITLKVGWRLLKAALAICLFAVIGFILLTAAASHWSGNAETQESRCGGAESERFYRFANGVTWLPRQVWGGFVLLLQLVTLAVAVSLERLGAFCAAHRLLSLWAAALAIGCYTAWSIFEEWNWEFYGGGYFSPPRPALESNQGQAARALMPEGEEK